MLAFDSLPSRPLPFAATLRPIDTATPPIALNWKLPKPRRLKDDLPTIFPDPPYSHSRRNSAFGLGQVGNVLDHPQPPTELGGDEWMQREVEKCLDSALGMLNLK